MQDNFLSTVLDILHDLILKILSVLDQFCLKQRW